MSEIKSQKQIKAIKARLKSGEMKKVKGVPTETDKGYHAREDREEDSFNKAFKKRFPDHA